MRRANRSPKKPHSLGLAMKPGKQNKSRIVVGAFILSSYHTRCYHQSKLDHPNNAYLPFGDLLCESVSKGMRFRSFHQTWSL